MGCHALSVVTKAELDTRVWVVCVGINEYLPEYHSTLGVGGGRFGRDKLTCNFNTFFPK